MRVAFAGTGKLGAELLGALLESHHEVVALIQNGRTSKGFRRWLYPGLARRLAARTNVLGMARRRGIPILYIDKMTDEELEPLRALEPDLLLVGGFAVILKAPLLRLPKIGCLNCHSSLLPKHRGPNPFTAVILANETETGVTFHVMDEGIDTGDIVEQIRIPIEPRATAGTLYKASSELAGERVVEVLDRIEREGLKGTPQDPAEASYDQKLPPERLEIDWTQPAEEIDRLVRACTPFMMVRTRYRGRPVYIMRTRFDSTPVDAAPGTIVDNNPRLKIATGEGLITVLIGYRIKPFPWLWPPRWNMPRIGERME